MIPIKEYYCEDTPTYEELKVAHDICIYEHCIVHLKWFIKYNGWNDRYVHKDTDIEKLNESLKHIIYGI